MSERVRWVGLAGVALALVGVWGPWVPHRAAALVLSGWDLAEYLKFVPAANVPRDLFYLPVWCAALALGLLASQSSNRLTTRVLALLIALGLMIALLPPYPDTLTGFRSAEHRWRFIFGASGIPLVLLAFASQRWPIRLTGGLVLVLAFLGSAPAVWQFLQVRNELEAVYGASLGWGWGVAALLVGWGTVGVAGGRLLFRSDAR